MPGRACLRYPQLPASGPCLLCQAATDAAQVETLVRCALSIGRTHLKRAIKAGNASSATADLKHAYSWLAERAWPCLERQSADEAETFKSLSVRLRFARAC